MRVIVSNNPRKKVYHRPGCPYAARIADAHYMEITRERASFYGFRRCQYCSSLKGSTRSLISTLKAQGAGKNLEITYLSDTDTIYIRTKIGFWKVWWKDDAGFLLYHLNQFDPEKSTKELLQAAFHYTVPITVDTEDFRHPQ